MKSLAIRDGDIHLSVSRRADFVTGKDKLFQDLSLWLWEPLGLGPTTPNFGSRLEEMVGSASSNRALPQVLAEVQRILALYQQWQVERLKKAKTAGTLQYWSRSEIINRVLDVNGRVSADAVIIRVSIETLAIAPNNVVQFNITLPTTGTG